MKGGGKGKEGKRVEMEEEGKRGRERVSSENTGIGSGLKEQLIQLLF